MKLSFKPPAEYIFFVIDLNLLIPSAWVSYFISGPDIGRRLKIPVLPNAFRSKIVYRLLSPVIKHYKSY